MDHGARNILALLGDGKNPPQGGLGHLKLVSEILERILGLLELKCKTFDLSIEKLFSHWESLYHA
jgi:hypothetical protein